MLLRGQVQVQAQCVLQWLHKYPSCPLCKKVVKGDLVRVDGNRIRARERRERERERECGGWGTKVDALVRDVAGLLGDPERQEEKALVFSQWGEMLDIVAEAFTRQGLPFARCADRTKDFDQVGSVGVFRTNPLVRVLLLPLALGAEGLDLTVASHVFLLEPLLNIHREAQAVHRINRVGQTRPCHVYKYVVRGTVEEGILRFQQQLTSQLEEQGGEGGEGGGGGGGEGGDGGGEGGVEGGGSEMDVARYNSLHCSKRTCNNDDVFLQERDILDMFGLL
ncbi:P-loop containing nucleoside triphosphate hydrolase protein [Ochromonadaceae sp. CCMP2298]|nr:P-loop containing nucleoside triphosphate hydrolase protein [Ochromonadaceae sp. CCMP2298]